MAAPKTIKTYKTTYDRTLTTMLEQFLVYTITTEDSVDDQKKLANEILDALKRGYERSIGTEL